MGRTAVDVLREEQRQLDPEGIEVGVSRQALDETLDSIAALRDAVTIIINELLPVMERMEVDTDTLRALLKENED